MGDPPQAGEILGWDAPAAGPDAARPGPDRPSLRGRLPADLRDLPPGPDFRALPFTPLYLTADEFAAEIINRTVHGVLHLGWVPDGAGRYHGQLAVLVKPNGLLGTGYMAAITPFRHLIVYPSMIRQIGQAWRAARRRCRPSPGPHLSRLTAGPPWIEPNRHLDRLNSPKPAGAPCCMSVPWALRGDRDLARLHWKLVIDAHDPHAQADFWAAALGYEVEDHSALIGKLLDLGAISPEILVGHHERRAWRDAGGGTPRPATRTTRERHGTGASAALQSRTAAGAEDGKNRLHIDLHPPRGRGTQRLSASTPSAPGSAAASRNRAASGSS